MCRTASRRCQQECGKSRAGAACFHVLSAPAIANSPVERLYALCDGRVVGLATASVRKHQLFVRYCCGKLQVHDYFPSDISEWRVSCSSTTMSNPQPLTEFATVGLALKWMTTWDGWKRTAILPAPSFAGCPRYSALLSSRRGGAA